MPGIESSFLTSAVSAWGLRAAGALVVFVVGRLVAGGVRRSVRRGLTRSETDPTLVPFLSGLAYYGLLTAVVIAVLALLGVQTTSLVAVLGAATLAVGFALQGTLSNFAAGVMLLVFRPFGKRDFIDAAGVSGTVDDIGIFSTTLNTPDNVRVVVPNAGISGSVIKNFSANELRRNDIVIGVAYDDDLNTAVDVIHRVLDEDGRVLDEPASVVAVGGLGESSVDLLVRPWCKGADYWALRADVLTRCKVALETAGCSIPFPQRDVRLIQPGDTAAA